MLDRTTPPAIRQIEHFRLPAPERMTLTNGIPLNVLRMGDEDVVRFDLLMRGGQWHQTQPLQAMFANRMLREGTRRFSSSGIAERLDFYGAWLDLSSSINYGFVTLYSLGKYLPQTLEIVASMVREPTMPEAEMETVVKANRQQFLINSGRVDVQARRKFNQTMFGREHPLGRPAETDDYSHISRDVLMDFYRAHYHSRNASIYISGRVTPATIDCVDRLFGKEDWGDTARVTVDEDHRPCPEGKKRIFIEKDDALQSSVKMGYFTISQSHPDFMKLKVLTTIYGGYFGSRLMMNVREDKGYTYGIWAGLVPYPGLSVFGISTETANEYVEPLIEEVCKEMDRLREERVGKDELDMVRSYMMGDLCRAYETAFSLPEAWIYLETAGLPDDFFERSVQAIREVTAEETERLAERYFSKEKLIAVVAGKKV